MREQRINTEVPPTGFRPTSRERLKEWAERVDQLLLQMENN